MKYLKDLKVIAAEHPREDYVLLKLTDPSGALPPMRPGQFVEVRVDGSRTTFLRRPISINFVDYDRNELWLLIHIVGDGTKALAQLKTGDTVNCLFPLGNGFTMPEQCKLDAAAAKPKRILLIGGGVGTAPLLYYGVCLKAAGHEPVFLLGGRRNVDILQLEHFEKYGTVGITTEDGSLGTKGFVTNHPFMSETFDSIATCGPKPMMMAVAKAAKASGTPLEVSLENKMACGLGACLCCVEKKKDGHNVCVCTEGPVFNSNDLPWQD